MAGAGDPERGPLVFRRVPARGQRQGHREGGAGHAQHHAQQQDVGEAVHAEYPGQAQACQDEDLGDDPGGAGPQVIDQDAHDHAKHGACEGRHRDHQPLLGGVEVQVGGDLDRERAEQHPDHEAQVEVEEGREQGGRMPGLEERFH